VKAGFKQGNIKQHRLGRYRTSVSLELVGTDPSTLLPHGYELGLPRSARAQSSFLSDLLSVTCSWQAGVGKDTVVYLRHYLRIPASARYNSAWWVRIIYPVWGTVQVHS
jgi:hypothetical protein